MDSKNALKFGKLGEEFDAATLALERSREYMQKLITDESEKALVRIKVAGSSFADGSGHVEEALNAIIPNGLDDMLRAAMAHLEAKHGEALTKLRDAMEASQPTPAKPSPRAAR